VGLSGVGRSSAYSGDEPDAFLEPLCGPGLVDLSGSDRQHGFFGLVDVGWVGVPSAVVEVDEHGQCCPSRPLVPVGEGMVLCQPTHCHSGLVVDVGIELHLPEPRPGGVQR